jgi:hypothetical protein
MMIWSWQSVPVGKTADGLGEEYVIMAKNPYGKNVVRQLSYKPELITPDEMASHVRSAISSMEKEIERLTR